MSNPNASLPLAGVRVLDLSRVLAGPWAAWCSATSAPK
jgi:crotonobetainyl-CoA:carnitine CoA-transferase CaiB-like acyl-CoA transferase